MQLAYSRGALLGARRVYGGVLCRDLASPSCPPWASEEEDDCGASKEEDDCEVSCRGVSTLTLMR